MSALLRCDWCNKQHFDHGSCVPASEPSLEVSDDAPTLQTMRAAPEVRESPGLAAARDRMFELTIGIMETLHAALEMSDPDGAVLEACKLLGPVKAHALAKRQVAALEAVWEQR